MNVGELVRAIYRRGPRRRTPCDVLRALAEHADDAGTCFPSHALLARKCRITPRTVLSSIAWLVEEGWLTVERGQGMPGRRKRGRTNLYRLNLKRIMGNDFTASSSGEIPSPETSSTEILSLAISSAEGFSSGKPCVSPRKTSGKPCVSPRKTSGKPVKNPLSGEIPSHEIRCIPPAPPILSNTQEKQKTAAKAEARTYDGQPDVKINSNRKTNRRPRLPYNAARSPSAPVPLRNCVQPFAASLDIDLRRVQ